MIQSLFPAKKNLITDLQNLNALGFCLYISYLCYFDKLENCDITLSAYLIFDLFFSSSESSLHHILTLSLTFYKSMYEISDKDSVTISRPFFKTEYSTIFLLIKYFYDEKAPESLKKNRFSKILYGINDLAFVTTFVKFRIFDLYTNAIQNTEIHQIINNYLHKDSYISYIQLTQFYTGMCGLYLLNFYWFCLISKKLYKQFVIPAFPQINTIKFAERLLPWTLFASMIPYIFNVTQLKSNCMLDIAGITAVSFASYNYHKYKSVMFDSGKDVYIMDSHMVDGMSTHDDNISMLFFMDQGSIHLKSVLTTMAMGSDAAFSSMILHFVFFFGAFIYSSQQNQIVYHATGTNEEGKRHMANFDLMLLIPSLYDYYNVIRIIDDRTVKSEIILSIVIMYLVNRMKPFYEINHVAIHLTAILQTWVLARAIMNVQP